MEWCWLCSREAQTDHWAGLGLALRAPHSPMTWVGPPPLPPPARHQVAPGETTRSREREVGFLLQNWPLGPPRRAIGWVCLLRTPWKVPYNRKKRGEKQTSGYIYQPRTTYFNWYQAFWLFKSGCKGPSEDMQTCQEARKISAWESSKATQVHPKRASSYMRANKQESGTHPGFLRSTSNSKSFLQLFFE